MKSFILLLVATILLSSFTNAQNLPACDSLVINCCAGDTANVNAIILEAANSSSELFDYPGFVLLDDNMDTVAKENVNYFGIGTFPQVHSLQLRTTLTLPFSGYLQLYSWFYDTLFCTFPIFIPDTTVGIKEISQDNFFSLSPNPANTEVMIDIVNRHLSGNLTVIIWNTLGKEILSIAIPEFPINIPLTQFESGIYLVTISDEQRKSIGMKRLMIE